jgi:DNA-binding MarR family transcriptional regulator
MVSDLEMEQATSALGLTLRFMRVLWALDHSLQASSKHMEAKLGVTGPQRLAVRIVGKLPGISAGDLAAVLHIHPSTLTGILRRLEERAAIRRVPDLVDGRKVHLVLTKRGESIDKLNSGTVEAAVRRALSNLTPKNVGTAERVLSLVVREMDAENGTKRPPSSGPSWKAGRWGRRRMTRVRR